MTAPMTTGSGGRQAVGFAASSRGATSRSDLEEEFRRQTVGLVSAEDFRRTRDLLEKRQRDAAEDREREALERKSRSEKVSRARLSFAHWMKDDDDDADADADEDEDRGHGEEGGEGEGDGPVPKKSRVMKNPHVDTSALPDSVRLRREEEERMRLSSEWDSQQEAAKSELLSITYSFYDGTGGHRRVLEVRRGTTIAQFLELVRAQFPNQLRVVPVDQLMLVKEDVILPHHYSFHDLIITRARGISGPLWQWDVHDDVRVLADATAEHDMSHAAKVVDRQWYQRHRHQFPAARWVVFDPHVQHTAPYYIK